MCFIQLQVVIDHITMIKLLFFVHLTILAFGDHIDPFPSVGDTINNCIQQYDLPQDKMLETWRELFTPLDNTEFSTLFGCVMAKFGVIKNDVFDPEAMKSILPPFISFRFRLPLEEGKKIFEKIDPNDCLHLPRNGDAGVHCVHVRNCLVQELLKVRKVTKEL